MRVALLAEKADIQFDPDETDANTLVSDIKGLGFGAQFIGESQGSEEGKVDLVVRNTFTLVSSSPPSCIYTLHVYHVAWFAVSLPSIQCQCFSKALDCELLATWFSAGNPN